MIKQINFEAIDKLRGAQSILRWYSTTQEISKILCNPEDCYGVE
jgi:hypothetical protein